MIEDLYFINANALAVKLHQQEVSEDLAFKHLLVFSMLFASALVFPVAVSCTQSDVFAFWYQCANFFAFALLRFWGSLESKWTVGFNFGRLAQRLSPQRYFRVTKR